MSANIVDLLKEIKKEFVVYGKRSIELMERITNIIEADEDGRFIAIGEEDAAMILSPGFKIQSAIPKTDPSPEHVIFLVTLMVMVSQQDEELAELVGRKWDEYSAALDAEEASEEEDNQD